MLVPSYLDKCKQVLDFNSDYKLAKRWEIDDSSMSQYRSGKLKADPYLCFRIAETLHESPSKIIAEVESENQRNEVKSLYFKRFFSISGLWITIAIMCLNFTTFSPSAEAYESGRKSVINQHNGTLYEALKRLKNHLNFGDIYDIFVAYFTCNWTRKAAFAA